MRLNGLYEFNYLSNGLQPIVICMALTMIVMLMVGCSFSSVTQISEVERRSTSINKMLMCPVCPGESIDQSQNDLAINMKRIVKEQIAEGKTDKQILNYFVQRYGVLVLMEPPRNGLGILVWTVPLVAFGVAIMAVLFSLFLMKRRGRINMQEEGLHDGLTGNDKTLLAAVVEDAYEDENIR
jgi:cytochrome c-type biogenesis protein CcmH/NrfF